MIMQAARPDRRTELRVSPKGAVIVRSDAYIIRGRVVNVSRSGLLASTAITAPERMLGATVDVTLRLDAGDASWFELRGRILRIGASSLAIGLDAVPSSFTRIIDQTLTRSLQHDRVLSVVLVDATHARRRAMAEGFRSVGCAVVEVSTPLEAVVRLGGSNFEPDLIAIADSLPATISNELRRFVDTEHPRAMMVTIGDALTAPEGLAHWLSAADGSGELAARIRDVLTRFR